MVLKRSKIRAGPKLVLLAELARQEALIHIMSERLWSFSLRDTHNACPVCLDTLHAKAVHANPESGARCNRLHKSTLEG